MCRVYVKEKTKGKPPVEVEPFPGIKISKHAYFTLCA